MIIRVAEYVEDSTSHTQKMIAQMTGLPSTYRTLTLDMALAAMYKMESDYRGVNKRIDFMILRETKLTVMIIHSFLYTIEQWCGPVA